MIESQENMIRYTVGTEKEYSFPIRFLKAEDIHCHVGSSQEIRELEPGVDFTVLSQSDYSTGGIVQIKKHLPLGKTLVISRVCDMTQHLALPEHGKLPSEGLETALDKLTMLIQEHREILERCVKIAATDGQKPEEVIAMLLGAKDMALTAAEASTNAAASASAANLSMQTIWAEITGNDASAQEALEALKQAFEAAGSVEAAAAAGRESVNAASLAAVQYAQGQIEESKDASLAVLSATTKDRKAELLALISETIGAEGAVAAAVKAAEEAATNAKESADSIDAATQEALASVNAAVGVADAKRQEAQAAANEAKAQAQQAGDSAAESYGYIAETLANRNASAQSAQDAAQSAASAQIAADAAAAAAGEAAETAAQRSITAHNSNVTSHPDMRQLINDKAQTEHGHTISDVTGLQTALDTKLPIAGGTLTGGLAVRGNVTFYSNVYSPDTNGDISFLGGTSYSNGGYMILFGQNYSQATYQGSFQLGVSENGNKHVLQAFKDGSIKWRGYELERVNDVGTNYIRLESGVQICWGTVSNSATNTTVTFPKAFSGYDIGVSITPVGQISSLYVSSLDPVKIIITGTYSGYTTRWVAIGKWK